MTEEPDPDPTWKKHSAFREGELVTDEFCPDRAYVQIRLPLDVGRVRRVVFRVRSHDQGFCSNPADGSWSWCNAAVINSSGHNRFQLQNILQNNPGDGEFQNRVCVWDFRESSERVQRLLRSIGPGDSIQLLPKARFSLWQNVVRQAEIEVFSENLAQTLSPVVPSPTTNASVVPQWITSYRRLDEEKKEIRLIRLHPGSWDEAISCQVVHVHLNNDEHENYECLSYCWGDLTESKTINVEALGASDKSVVFPVTSNLHDALRHLREGHSEDRVLWVDAICINQHDIRERARQVSIMKEIYSKATVVLVWLGLSSGYLQDAVNDARKALESHHQKICKGGPSPQITRPPFHAPVEGDHAQDTPILGFDYFKRSWVLQEVFNAKDIVVHCGKNTLPWSLILRLNQCMMAGMGVIRPIPRPVMPALFASLFDLQESQGLEYSLTYSKTQRKHEILDVFVQGLDLDASDPRDKLFALLAFGEETSDTSKLPKEIAVDYGKSVGQVYVDFTRWWIVRHRSLRILSTVHASVGRTWQNITSTLSPPYGDDRASWSLWHDGCRSWAITNLEFSDFASSFRASGDEQVDIDRILSGQAQDPRVLTLTGRHIATVKHIRVFPYYLKWTPNNTPSSPNHLPFDLFSIYELLFDPMCHTGAWLTGVDIYTTAIAVAVAPQPRPRPRPRPSEISSAVHNHYVTHLGFSNRTGGVECHPPCLLVTEDGGVGLCPPGTREGDVVVVLCGGRVPYILRPIVRPLRPVRPTVTDIAGESKESEESKGAEAKGSETNASETNLNGLDYHLIGECYLQGYMHGEAVSKSKQEDGSERFPVMVFNLH